MLTCSAHWGDDPVHCENEARWHILWTDPGGWASRACDPCFAAALREKRTVIREWHELLSECGMPGTGWYKKINVCAVWDGTQEEAWPKSLPVKAKS